jgi:hypothetical protein
MMILLLAGCSSPTPEAAPTSPTATETPIPPTATPTLTSTATPTTTATPTGSPTATGTVAAGGPYLDEVNVNLQGYQNALADASNYVQAPTTDFSVLMDADWKQNAGMALNQLDEDAQQLESIENAPPEQEQLDMQLNMIASETHELVDNFGNGMNQLDLGAINRAINNIGNITAYINNATTELEKYNNP